MFEAVKPPVFLKKHKIFFNPRRLKNELTGNKGGKKVKSFSAAPCFTGLTFCRIT
jgi:hypothetical protein